MPANQSTPEVTRADRIALEDVTPTIAAAFGDDMCLIWSGEWQSYWRADGNGYTKAAAEAGRFTILTAYAKTQHCDPSKQIMFERTPARGGDELREALANCVSALCSVRKNYEQTGTGLWDDVSRFIAQGNAALASTDMAGAGDRYADGYAQGQRDAEQLHQWMQDKAWQDAVLMLVHYQTLAERTWLVGHEEAAVQLAGWWKRAKALAETKSVEDIASAPPVEGLTSVHQAPVPMILHCPRCHVQHVDEPTPEWDNPPHRSHLCLACGCIWRPADVPTQGVANIATVGKADTPLVPVEGLTSGEGVLREALQRIQDEPDHILPIVTAQRLRNIAGFALLGERLP